jgi:hypothetical protein
METTRSSPSMPGTRLMTGAVTTSRSCAPLTVARWYVRDGVHRGVIA